MNKEFIDQQLNDIANQLELDVISLGQYIRHGASLQALHKFGGVLIDGLVAMIETNRNEGNSTMRFHLESLKQDIMMLIEANYPYKEPK